MIIIIFFIIAQLYNMQIGKFFFLIFPQLQQQLIIYWVDLDRNSEMI